MGLLEVISGVDVAVETIGDVSATGREGNHGNQGDRVVASQREIARGIGRQCAEQWRGGARQNDLVAKRTLDALDIFPADGQSSERVRLGFEHSTVEAENFTGHFVTVGEGRGIGLLTSEGDR